ncbi:MalY/PatB family protein [Dethiothermospora halolimnae]|uniref:MalY/PatB family protein n=1 Tax=Dethiothermospora halolimnae TaxID=3114390 RepID=UPI003CCC2B2B
MKYNFDEVVDRMGTNSIKWDGMDRVYSRDDILPLWVADMDFKAPKPVIDALIDRAKHGIYGYSFRPDSYYEAIVDWIHKRHGWKIEKDWIEFSPGIVPAINIAVMTYTEPGDKIIVQNPVYYPFFSAVENNNRELLYNQLRLKDGKYFIDFDDLEKKIKSGAKMLILCSPSNPTGRVWTKDELERLGKLCTDNNVLIVSDEIHSDIVYKEHKHIPIASISRELLNNTITCMAPSKTFNIAGLSTSEIIIPNKKLRKKFNKEIERIHVGMTNVFGIEALEAAYREGEEWLDQLLIYLQENVDFIKEYIANNIPKIEVVDPEGTYLIWLDCRGLGMNNRQLKRFMIEEAKVGLNDGPVFRQGGEGFQRINIGCPRSILKEGLERIEKAVKKL